MVSIAFLLLSIRLYSSRYSLEAWGSCTSIVGFWASCEGSVGIGDAGSCSGALGALGTLGASELDLSKLSICSVFVGPVGPCKCPIASLYSLIKLV